MEREVIIPDADGVIVLLSAILKSPVVLSHIQQMVDRPPAGLDLPAFLAVLADIHRAAAQSEAQTYELDRENAAAVLALEPDSQWTTEQAATHLATLGR